MIILQTKCSVHSLQQLSKTFSQILIKITPHSVLFSHSYIFTELEDKQPNWFGHYRNNNSNNNTKKKTRIQTKRQETRIMMQHLVKSTAVWHHVIWKTGTNVAEKSTISSTGWLPWNTGTNLKELQVITLHKTVIFTVNAVRTSNLTMN
jgi:hypothetical protein